MLSANSLGIIAGLLLGKPIGIVLATAIGVAVGLCRLPPDVGWRHIVGAGLLGGIGFTMSIFITLLAFADRAGSSIRRALPFCSRRCLPDCSAFFGSGSSAASALSDLRPIASGLGRSRLLPEQDARCRMLGCETDTF